MKTKTIAFLFLLITNLAYSDELYPTVALTAFMAARDVRKGVKYLTDEERGQIRLVIENGVVLNHLGQRVPDSVNTLIGHINHVNYVMDSEGNFYLFNEYETPEIRHSSILAGKPVAGAGEITIKDSHVIYIDADSGHYASSSLMRNVFKQLEKDGVNLKAMVGLE